MNYIYNSLTILGVGIILALLISFAMYSLKETTRVLKTQGNATASASPQVAIFDIGIESERDFMQQILEKVNEKNVKTVFYNVADVEKNNEVKRIVTHRVQISTHPNSVSSVIQRAREAGANYVGNITYEFKQDKITELEDASLKEAIEDAHRTAQLIAEKSGVKLGKVLSISNVNHDLVRPVYHLRTFSAESQIQGPQSQNINSSVEVMYEIQ